MAIEIQNYTVLRYIISTSTSSTSKHQMQSYEYFIMQPKINDMFLENSITSESTNTEMPKAIYLLKRKLHKKSFSQNYDLKNVTIRYINIMLNTINTQCYTVFLFPVRAETFLSLFKS